jgi:hypothetical protein
MGLKRSPDDRAGIRRQTAQILNGFLRQKDFERHAQMLSRGVAT